MKRSLTKRKPGYRIGLVLFRNATQLDLTAPYEIFARMPESEVFIVSHTRKPVVTDRGLRLLADTTYKECPSLDVLFVPGGPGQIEAQEDKRLMAFILACSAKKHCLLASVCTGALMLGAAGLLQGKNATTHWTCMDILPLLGATPMDMPVVEDGRIITGAGVTNGIDLALHIAEKLCGRKAAQAIARQIEYPHASEQDNKAELLALSRDMLAENPYRKARRKQAQETAKRLGIRSAVRAVN